MKTRQLGELTVSELGLGCMSMSQSYGDANRKESERTLHRALDLGYTFLDTASLYGMGHNESLVGDVLSTRRNEFVLASKCGIINKNGKRAVDCTPANVKKTCEESLKRLKTDVIDLYYLHRRDFNVPIQESVGALADLVKAGKIRYIGLSECSSSTIRKAHQEHPICAIQSEYSLWTREPEHKVFECCTELGIGFVPFSPLGRAFLTGAVKDMSELGTDDMRQTMPRFIGENFQHNLKLLQQLEEIATRYDCTMAQLALAWVLAQNPNFVPIPGTKFVNYVEENAASVELSINEEDLKLTGEIFSDGKILGDQYAKSHMISLDTEED
ncbi:MAG: aldo/keto reductase [SAR86 cluster bacterium]|uniref:Aldo/keto reductase n=1 Tax=SAR86 cluster bacterium TaxID=2030880 RepID=A0A2A5B3Z1_9GAMM|nr:MAG: aldo/keto reductase [SAR86 cluster bacterium]